VTTAEYRLQRPRTPASAGASAVVLDPSQQAVLDHVAMVGGPLQVLAGPGSGKTTTLVELVAQRVESGAVRADEVLVLTFSRAAAQEVRARIGRRLARTTSATPAMTFHAFCYALVRAEQDADDFRRPVTLLTAPEHDAMLAELLAGTDPERWPVQLRQALRTQGMSAELQRLFAAARAQGLDAVDLRRAGEASGRADWVAASEFFEEVTEVSALKETIDHTDLVHQAVRLLDDPGCRERWRRRLRLVVVDEFQDTDPLQVQLLQALAGDGRDLVVVGDPYQSIYRFRGADVRGTLEFGQRFATPRGPAPSLTLARTNRYGAAIAGAVRSVVENKGVFGALDVDAFRALRSPATDPDRTGQVAVRTFTSATAEAEHVALLLREAHLADEPSVPWERMAVLVRSSTHLDRLHRALTAAGVPVQVAGDELPLAVEPAVRTLLAGLHAAQALLDHGALDPDAATALLTGPLGELDAAALRRLGRVLRADDAARHGQPRASRLLVAEALADPHLLDTLEVEGPSADAVGAARAVAHLLADAAALVRAGGSAEEVLWALWDGTSWPRRLREEAEGGGDGAARAHHDLDALCALFAEAARAEERQAHRGVGEVVRALEAQQIPAGTVAGAADLVSGVQLMTAHRSKGLEWDLVVVAGVQDGEWPDTRLRSSLLQPDRLTPDGVGPYPSPREAVAEERRLFYVACSRARERLVVTAVASGSDDGDQPSRFVGELHAHLAAADGPEAPRRRSLPVAEHRPRRALSLRSAVAELRRIGEHTDDPDVRHRVAEQLARLADHPAGRAAHPSRWWGLAERTESDAPWRPDDRPLRLSGSQVSALMQCPLRWFLDHEAKGAQATTSAQGFGSIVHAIAADVVQSGRTPDVDELAAHLDDVWTQLDLPPWISRREHDEAVAALDRFVRWHRENPREVLAAEHGFEVELDVDGRTVVLAGSMDRVERSADGVHVVDLKTGKGAPSRDELAAHPQLGLYQLVVQHGATADLAGAAPPAGAELVQLRQESRGVVKVQQQAAPEPDVPFFAVEQLRRSVHTLVHEEVAATEATGGCGYCQFTRVCPAHDAGASILVREQREREAGRGERP
jgi:superfamily I DNA/RNA helicase